MQVNLNSQQRAAVKAIGIALYEGKGISRQDKRVLDSVDNHWAEALRLGLAMGRRRPEPSEKDPARLFKLCKLLLQVRSTKPAPPAVAPTFVPPGAPSGWKSPQDWHSMPQPYESMPRYRSVCPYCQHRHGSAVGMTGDWTCTSCGGSFPWFQWLFDKRQYGADYGTWWQHAAAKHQNCPLCRQKRIQTACQPGCPDCSLAITTNQLLWDTPLVECNKRVHRMHLY